MSTPIQITGSIVGVEAVVARLGVTAPANAVARLRTTVHQLGIQLETKVKLEKLNGQVLKRRSGRLAGSINTRFVDTQDSSTATVGTALRYGRIWELTGSPAYTITAIRKKALFWPGAAHPVKSVLHPAQAPRPFLRPALDEMRTTIRAQLEAAMKGL